MMFELLQYLKRSKITDKVIQDRDRAHLSLLAKFQWHCPPHMSFAIQAVLMWVAPGHDPSTSQMHFEQEAALCVPQLTFPEL